MTTAKGVSNVRRLRQVVEDHDGAVPEPALRAGGVVHGDGSHERGHRSIGGPDPGTCEGAGSHSALDDDSRHRTHHGVCADHLCGGHVALQERSGICRLDRDHAAEHRTGGRHRTGAITKMGQRDLRALLVQGAMAVALANKMARTA